MSRRDRLQMELINNVRRVSNDSDSFVSISEKSCYKSVGESSESHILSSKQVSGMNMLIGRAIEDDRAAKVLTAITFLDLYTNEKATQEHAAVKQEKESLEVPAYTYTL